MTLRHLSLLVLLILGACGQSSRTLTGLDRDAVLSFTEPKTENLLAGFNATDYVRFSRDFNLQMRTAIPESAMQQTRQQITGRIGKYLSRRVSSVEQIGGLVRVTYSATFDEEDNVTVQVVFEPNGDHLVTGLFFTSPKLRGQ